MSSLPSSSPSSALQRSWLRAKVKELFAVDTRSIALFRVCIGFALLFTYLNYLPYTESLLSDAGVYVRTHALRQTTDFRLSLYLANGSPAFALILLSLSIAFAVAAIANWRPRLSIFASLVLFQSLAVRNDEMTFGLHTAMQVLLFWALFLPYERSGFTPGQKKPRRLLSIAALGLILSSLAILYGAGIGKFKNYDFWIGNANALEQLTTYYTNNHPLTQMMRLFPPLLRFLSRATIIVELGIIPVLFIPYKNSLIRIITLLIGALFFLGITLCIHVGVFPLLPFIALLVLTPTEFWEWWQKTNVRRELRHWMVQTSTYIQTRGRRIRSAVLYEVEPMARFAAWVFLAVFAVATLNNSMPQRSAFLSQALQWSGFSWVLDLANLDHTWDWVYTGPMTTKLLLAEYETDKGNFTEDITSTPYTGFFYNYWMNYANAVMNNDWLVNQYFQYHCTHPGGGVPAGATIDTIKLYIVYNAAAITDAAKRGEPYRTSLCPRIGASGPDAASIAPLLRHIVGNLSAFPLLEARQDFKEVQFDKNVYEHPISLAGVRYAKGIGTHANSRITFFVAGATRFSAVAGIDDEVKSSPYSSVILRVEGDGRELYRSPLLLSSSTPVKLNLRINGISRLSLIAEDAGTGKDATLTYDDHVSWGSATVWKE